LNSENGIIESDLDRLYLVHFNWNGFNCYDTIATFSRHNAEVRLCMLLESYGTFLEYKYQCPNILDVWLLCCWFQL